MWNGLKQEAAARKHHCFFAQERREGRMKKKIPSMNATIACLSLSPYVKAVCNVHCACIVNYYLPASAFDKSVFSPSFRPRSMEQWNLFAYNSY